MKSRLLVRAVLVAVFAVFVACDSASATPTPTATTEPATPSPAPATSTTGAIPTRVILSRVGVISPEDTATGVHLDTDISFSVSRPVPIVRVSLQPGDGIELVLADTTLSLGSEVRTYSLSELLEPNTSYTVSVVYGQEFDPGVESTETRTWTFTTGS